MSAAAIFAVIAEKISATLCYPWQTGGLYLQLGSNAGTAIACFTLAVGRLTTGPYGVPLVQRQLSPFVLLLLVNGTGSAVNIWNLWHSDAGLRVASNAIVAFTPGVALVSTAATMMALMVLLASRGRRTQRSGSHLPGSHLPGSHPAQDRLVNSEVQATDNEVSSIRPAALVSPAASLNLEMVPTPASIRVLIVDDCESDRLVIRRYLSKDDTYAYQFLEAETGEDAVALLQQAPDIVFLDYLLPDSEGLDVLEELRKYAPISPPPIVVLTGQGDEEIAASTIKAGAQDYLVKSKVEPTRLIQITHQIIYKQQLSYSLRLNQRRRQLMVDLSLRIHRCLDLSDMLKIAVEDIRQVLGCATVAIKQVVANGQTQSLAHSSSGKIAPETSNQLSVPIYLADSSQQSDLKTWGFITADYKEPLSAGSEDLKLLSEISVQLGISIHQASLIQHLEDEIEKRRQIECHLLEAQKRLKTINQELDSDLKQHTQLLGQTNQQLQKKTGEFEAIFQSLPDAVLFTDLDHRIRSYNQAAINIFEHDSGQLIGHPLAILVVPKADQKNRAAGGFVPEPQSDRTSCLYRRADSTTFVGETVFTAVIDNSGDVIGYLSIIRDISKRVAMQQAQLQAEKTLKQREAQLALFVEHTPSAVAMLNKDMRYIHYSRRWLKDYGLGEQNLVGRSHYEVFPEVPERWKKHHQRCLGGETLSCEEDPFPRADGEIDWISWKLHPWYQENGEVGGVIMLTEVITETKRLKQKLLSQQQLEAFFAAGSDAKIGTAILDEDCRYLRLNQPIADISGRPVSEHIGLTIADANPSLAPKILPVVQQVLQKNISVRKEIKNQLSAPQRSRYWLMSCFPLASDSRGLKQVGIVMLEITRRKNTEQDLKKLNTELKRSNQELEQFAYVASHDLREPLRKVRNYSDLLERRYQGQLDERADKYIAYIADGATRMTNLINDLLDYSRVGRKEGAFKSLSLHQTLTVVISDLQHKIQASEAEVLIRNPLPNILGNEVQMRQLLQNLIENSLKYRSKEFPKIVIDVVNTDAFWQISVQDNGIGLDPQFSDRVFALFQRLHVREAFEGTGIGLSICKRIVENHGGIIWVESEPNKGATFFFTLPKMEDALTS